jgi:tetratricopeptide (TPR) repeat protein
MYRSSLFLTAALMGTSIALVQPMAAAKSASEVEAIARAVTVEIKFKFRGNDGKIVEKVGSGTIIDRVASLEGNRKGDVYTLVTNKHVVCGGHPCSELPLVESYKLSLADGQQYLVKGSNIKLLGDGLDLATIQFRSNRNYAVAKLAAPGSLKIENEVYTAGFPDDQMGFEFGEGKAIAVVDKRLTGDRGGYTIIYDAFTLPGMSGGGVFNGSGQLVAIHGYGDQFKENTDIDDKSKVGSKIGYNRGIPVRWLVQNLAEVGINLGTARSTSGIRAARAQVPATADEYFVAGFNKFVEPGDSVVTGKLQAIQDFSKAIQLNSKYQYAYFMRAFVYKQVQEFQRSLANYNQAILVNPKYFEAYYNRAILKNKLNDIQGALADYNQAILVNPKYFEAYYNRASLKNKLNDI